MVQGAGVELHGPGGLLCCRLRLGLGHRLFAFGELAVPAFQFVDAGIVKTPVDLYRLGVLALANLERMGERSAQNLLAAIENSRSTSKHAATNTIAPSE